MKKSVLKNLVSALALSLSLALTVPSVLPLVSTITTVEAASAATLSQKSATLRTGEILKLKIKNKGKNSVKWTTSKSKVATVKNGVVTAVGKGNAVITAKVGNKKLKCKVSVSENSYSLNLPNMSSYVDSSVVYIPTKVYYKNGKLYCKTILINKEYAHIKKFSDKNGNDISKLNVVLSTRTYTSDTAYTDTIIAKGKVKNTFPKNIAFNHTKSFTIEFSGSQIRKKGFDLSKVNVAILDSKTDLYIVQ